jgi:hypothetical protein
MFLIGLEHVIEVLPVLSLPSCTTKPAIRRTASLPNHLASTVASNYNTRMLSRLFSLLLIVNLLACPVRCLSCETNVAAGEDVATAACSCCSHGVEASASESPEQSPRPCGDDCNCQNCICEGAVVEADVVLPDSPEQSGQWVRAVMVVNPTAALLDEASPRRSRAPNGRLLCGRDVRVAHQSWLI